MTQIILLMILFGEYDDAQELFALISACCGVALVVIVGIIIIHTIVCGGV